MFVQKISFKLYLRLVYFDDHLVTATASHAVKVATSFRVRDFLFVRRKIDRAAAAAATTICPTKPAAVAATTTAGADGRANYADSAPASTTAKPDKPTPPESSAEPRPATRVPPAAR